MFLLLTARQLAVHADRDRYGGVTVFFSGDVMVLLSFVCPILKTPREPPPFSFARRFARARLMSLSCSSMTALSLHRLPIEFDERQFADTIELTENIGAGLEWPEPFAGVARPQSDEGFKVRGVVTLQKFVYRSPVASDVACGIMGNGDVVQVPLPG
jgi:hypothetical protein